MTKSGLFFFFLVLLTLFLPGCATTEKDTTKDGREKISTVPWNRPASWEGQGSLGGLGGITQ